ncbi:MAG: hypothetical protein ABH834_02645 [Candidatus Altiarchaeota archaeon]
MDVIEINNKNFSSILNLLGKEINDEGYIADKKNKKVEICPYSKEPVSAKNFSIMPGSFVFINNYAYCFTEHMARYDLG